MITSEAGRQSIKNEEGWKLEPYICPAGKWTIGAGHRLYPNNVVPGLTWTGKNWTGKVTNEIAEGLLTNDLHVSETAIRSHVLQPINQNQFDALVSFVLNIGTQAFYNSTLLRFLNDGSYTLASEQFRRWTHDDNGKPINGLISRRQREQKRFLTAV